MIICLIQRNKLDSIREKVDFILILILELIGVGSYIIIDAYTTTTAADFARVYNDSFVKRYLTALMKRQWGMNLIKFQGVKLPGGIELNGSVKYMKTGKRK